MCKGDVVELHCRGELAIGRITSLYVEGGFTIFNFLALPKDQQKVREGKGLPRCYARKRNDGSYVSL